MDLIYPRCLHGHLLTDSAVYIDTRGTEQCRRCNALTRKRYRERVKRKKAWHQTMRPSRGSGISLYTAMMGMTPAGEPEVRR